MKALRWIGFGCGAGAALAGVLLATAGPPTRGESERSIKQAEVPRAALDALRKIAGEAEFREFAEEIEHGHTFYEGSWQGPQGNVDALVTASGDLVEIEEMFPAERAPAAVRSEAARVAGEGVKLTFEKKTLLLYEVHFKKGGGEQEMMLTPDGRRYYELDADEGD